MKNIKTKFRITKKILLVTISLLIALSSCSQKKSKVKIQEGHKIIFNIEGLENQEILLAYHHTSKHYISDTIQLNDKGIGVLEGPEEKPKGVYLVVIPTIKNKYFEFLISEQHFTIKNSTKDLVKNLSFIDSKENEIFTQDMLAMSDFKNKAEALNKEVKDKDEATKKAVQEQIQEMNTEFLANRDKIVADNPDMFYSDLLGLMKVVKIPDAPKDENGEVIDAGFGWKYWKEHYWDYTDFTERGILRTPIFHSKLLNYMDKRTEPSPDSIITSCRRVIEMAKAEDEVFKFTLVTLLNKYANSKVMGHDAVYVDIVKRYYESGDATWADSTSIAKMIERANAIAPLTIGNLSPDLVLRDTTLKVKYKLHDLPAEYTVVFVWDPECGHCKTSAPIIRDFYNKYKEKGIMVYSIATINYQEIDKWKSFIREKNLNFINVADPYVETNFREIYDISSTPQLYVLDKDKKIIAKRIGAKQLEEFFFNYFKINDKERFVGMEGLTFEAPVDSTKH